MSEKEILVATNDRRLASRAAEAGFRSFVSTRDLKGLGRVDLLRREGDDLHRNGNRIGHWISLRDRTDERAVRALKGRAELVVVETPNWKVIPLENLIAALGGKTRLFALAQSPEEARLFLSTLEKGVDGIVVQPKSFKDLTAFRDALVAARTPYKLEAAAVTRVEPVGNGERVCVDTANLFQPGEGLLVGSSSHGFFLVAAETAETEFVAARPFRVNAGAVHAYVLNGATTQYLSEIRSGGRLEAVDAKGHRREVVVGRAKIETRPLLLVEANLAGDRFSVLLQNAETVRLSTPRGTKSVADLQKGDKVLMHREAGARHFGMKIEERIREQ